MNTDYMSIKDYIEEKKDNIFVVNYVYCQTMGLLLVLCIILMLQVKIKNNYYGKIHMCKDEVYTSINNEYLDYFLNNCELMINNKKISYKIFMVMNYGNTSKIVFDIDLKNAYMASNIVDFELLISEDNIFTYLYRTIK